MNAGGYDAVRTIQTVILSASDVTAQVTSVSHELKQNEDLGKYHTSGYP